jgi:hypothetical protein
MKNLSILIIFIISIAQISFAQKKEVYYNDNYNFQLTLPDGWLKPKIEETNKKDVVSYTFDHKKDTTAQVLLLAFKIESIKDLDNFIYVLEKDATLNIPPKSGDYTSFDNGYYDGKFALYKDLQFTELIYYYRTKFSESKENYAYMLRFISTNYTAKAEKQFKEIVENFKIFEKK